MSEKTYASPEELLVDDEFIHLVQVSEDLGWFVDCRRNPAEVTAFSGVPGISYGISLRTDPDGQPDRWRVRVLHHQGVDALAFPLLSEAMGYCSRREDGFLDMYGAAA